MKLSHALGLALVLIGAPALAQEPRFAVVDVSAARADERLVSEVERQIARLRPGAAPIDEPAMRRLLATGEGPAAAATRLLHEAEDQRATGACDAAVARAEVAEALTLNNVPLDDERDLLKRIYTVLVACEAKRGRDKELAWSASRLRALVELAPDGLPPELWSKHVENALPGAATSELQIDSEPGNAQIAIDFHGDGVTPRTLKIAPGVHYIEVQKDGFRKAFRKITMGAQPVRTVFRLVARTADRLDQAAATLALVRRAEPGQRAPGLARLAQLARAELLVVLAVDGDRAKIWFFDAERGGLAKDAVESEIDAASFQVKALSDLPTPGAAPRRDSATAAAPTPTTRKPGMLAPAPGAAPATKSPQPAAEDALPEAAATATVNQRWVRPPAPWWGWLVAGALAGALGVYIFMDQPKRADTLAVRARWTPPR